MAVNELDVAVLASELFESLGVRHFIRGSMASSLYGESRSTHDVDIAAALRELWQKRDDAPPHQEA